MYSPRRSGWTQKARPSLIDMKETLLRIVINTFMLERGPSLTEFINRVTKQQRPCLLRPAGAPRRVHPGRLRERPPAAALPPRQLKKSDQFRAGVVDPAERFSV